MEKEIKYKILEKQGYFIVYYGYMKFSLLKFKKVMKWEIACMPLRIATPAEYATLEEAKRHIEMAKKPTIVHYI